MGITAAGSFLGPEQSLVGGTASLALVFGMVNLPCICAWAAAGTGLGRLLTNERRRRAINGVLAALLVGTVYLINT